MTNNPGTAGQKLLTRSILLLTLFLIVLVLFITDLATGTVKIPSYELIKIMLGHPANAVWKTILIDFRIPKSIAAVLAGSALSVSGLQMQTLFRNPLAGPDVLGVSSGASLGVALVVMGFGNSLISGSYSVLGGWVQIIAAWIGAGVILMLIMMVSIRVRDIMTILILGILFGSATSAFVSILQYFSPQSLLKAFVIWSMGSLGNITGNQLVILTISIIAGFVISFSLLKVMNAMLLGERYSKSMGINIKAVRMLIFISTSILSGSITAFCGPIAFVGIAVPHLARMMFNSSDHFILVPASVLMGSGLMLLADLLSQIPGSGLMLPVNSVTAILGIPVVIWVIIRNRRFAQFN